MASTIDKQFIEYIIKSLVSKPDAVAVERKIDEKGVLLELTVDPEDLGRVIGKRGATAQSLRTLLRALGTKNDARYNLKIMDVGDTPSSAPASNGDDRTEPKEAEPADEPAADGNDESKDDEEEKPTESGAVSRARQELADLDDLDV